MIAAMQEVRHVHQSPVGSGRMSAERVSKIAGDDE
jgi:hypothetical protein